MSNNRTIWIINQYASTTETGLGGRHYYLADELGKLGYQVYVIASSYTHVLRAPPVMENDFYFDQQENFTFVWIKVPTYKDAHSKQRVLNWFLFLWRSQKLASLIADKPDIILCSSPSIFSFLGAEKLAKKFNVPLIFEVRDIWPLTLIELGGYSPKHPFIKLMQWVEDRAYRKANIVISNLKNSVEHMINRGMDPHKFHWIPNGISLAEISEKTPLNQHTQSAIPNHKFIVGYTGTLGIANALNVLIEAASQLKHYTDIAFVIVGSGKEKREIQQMIHDFSLRNVYLLESIPKKEIQSLLALFNVLFVGAKNEKIYHFGVSPNKLFDYLYAGKPILYAIDSGNFHPIHDAGAGIEVEPENTEKLTEAILNLYHAPQETLQKMGDNGRKAALEEYEYGKLAIKLEKILFPSK